MSELIEPETAEASGVALVNHPIRRFVDANRAPLGTSAVFVVMMAVFIAANPHVFSQWSIYRSVLTTLPVALFLVVPLVFVVTAGEIDLSFPATMGFSAWTFALIVNAGFTPYLGVVAGVATGMILGLIVGSIVVYFNIRYRIRRADAGALGSVGHQVKFMRVEKIPANAAPIPTKMNVLILTQSTPKRCLLKSSAAKMTKERARGRSPFDARCPDCRPTHW